MIFSYLLILLLSKQLIVGISHSMVILRRKSMINQRKVINFYIFHHIAICIIRSFIVLLVSIFILLGDRCLSVEFILHFLLLLSTFDLLLIIIGETAHFWDSSINHRSTLYSKCFLAFGLCLIYSVSSLFLAIHITMGGDNPLVISLCKNIKRKLHIHQFVELEQSIVPTVILYVFFLLINVLTVSWIYIAHKDIAKLKRKSLASVFFYTLLPTKSKETERSQLVDQSLKRLKSICIFVLSNMIAILPVLTMNIFYKNPHFSIKLTIIYFSILPWIESVMFLFFPELNHRAIKKRMSFNSYRVQKRIGERLSSHRDTRVDLEITQ